MGFTPEFLQELQRALAAVPQELIQKIPKGSWTQNAFKEYMRVAPQERAEILEKYIRVLIASCEPASLRQINTARVFPVIRRRSYFTGIALRPDVSARRTDVWFKELTPHVCIGLAEDRGESIRVLTEEDIGSLKRTDVDIFAKALENLRGEQPHIEQIEEGVWCFSGASHGQDTAYILLPEYIEQIAMRGTPAAFLISPNQLFIVESERMTSAYVEKLLANYKTTDHPISAVPLLYAQGSWWEASQIRFGQMVHEVGRTIWLVERLEEAKELQRDIKNIEVGMLLPDVISLGLNLNTPTGSRLVCVTGTSVPRNTNEPFMLTEAITYSISDQSVVTLWVDSVREVAPDALSVDGRHDPAICRFTRYLTMEEIQRVQIVQNGVFQQMLLS